MSKTPFLWNADDLERRSQRCSHFMLGLMGLALMAMMMNLASFYLLVPGVILIFILRMAQQYYDQLQAEFDEAEVTLSPKTLMIAKPSTGSEQRIRYKEITAIKPVKRWGIQGIQLQISEQEAIDLAGFDEGLEAALMAAWKEHH